MRINSLNLNYQGNKISKKQALVALAALLLSGQAKAQDIQIINPNHKETPSSGQYPVPYFVVYTPTPEEEQITIYNPHHKSDEYNEQYAIPYYYSPTATPYNNGATYNPVYVNTQTYSQQSTSFYPTSTPIPTPKVDDRAPVGSDFYYAILQYGDKYEIQAHYDSGRNGVGAYYQYGNQAFSKKDGKRINNPEKLYGFKPIKEENTGIYPQYYAPPSTYQTYPQNSYTAPQIVRPTSTPMPKVDPRAPKGSDFYYMILRLGDRYRINPHYDAGPGGIGTYYQYGPYAFDKNGKQISNPKNLWGFDENIK